MSTLLGICRASQRKPLALPLLLLLTLTARSKDQRRLMSSGSGLAKPQHDRGGELLRSVKQVSDALQRRSSRFNVGPMERASDSFAAAYARAIPPHRYDALMYMAHHMRLQRFPQQQRLIDVDAARRLRAELQPPYEKLFVALSKQHGGVKLLADMRAHLTDLIADHGEQEERALLKSMDADLLQLFRFWFSPGLLTLRRLTFDSPASLLQSVVANEAVHAVRSVQELKQRLGAGRRLFAFFHPQLLQQPLIFVNVALCDSFPTTVQSILKEKVDLRREERPHIALLYSISLAHQGLHGVDLGHALISSVIGSLRSDFPSLQSICTISPIPGFRAWIETKIAMLGLDSNAAEAAFLRPKEKSALLSLIPSKSCAVEVLDVVLRRRLSTTEEGGADVLKPILLRLCAHYLVNEKLRSMPLDPVARFHIRNGATLNQLIWRGDSSAKGFRESMGIMASFDYSKHAEASSDIEESESDMDSNKMPVSSSLMSLLDRADAV